MLNNTTNQPAPRKTQFPAERLEKLMPRLNRYAANYATEAMPADDLVQIAIEQILLGCLDKDNDTYCLKRANWRMRTAVSNEGKYTFRICDPKSDEECEYNDGEDGVEVNDLDEILSDHCDSVESLLEKSETRKIMIDLLVNLGSFHKQIISHLENGKSQREIARELGTSQRRISYHALKIREMFQMAGITSSMM